MNRRTFTAAAAAAILAPSAAFARKLSLSEISNYFNKMTSVEADFRQTNPDGSVSKGRVYIRRPGRMRFEYAPPEPTLVLASGGQVAIFDGKSNQPPEQYPLAQTPLNLILAKRVDLARARMVIGHTEQGGLTFVTAQDPDHPEFGSIQMAFSASPVALRQWTIRDQSGGRTTVVLGRLEIGRNYPPSLFSVTSEMGKGKRRRDR